MLLNVNANTTAHEYLDHDRAFKCVGLKKKAAFSLILQNAGMQVYKISQNGICMHVCQYKFKFCLLCQYSNRATKMRLVSLRYWVTYNITQSRGITNLITESAL